MWDDQQRPAEPVPPTWGNIRLGRSFAAATLAESAIGRRLGWDMPVFRGQVAADVMGGAGSYFMVSPSAFLMKQGAAVDFLQLASWTQFGNAMRQLRNIFYVARKYRARRIVFPKPHPFLAGNRAGSAELRWNGDLQPPEDAGLVGDFYYLTGLGLAPRPDEQAAIIARSVRPLLTPRLRALHPGVGDNDIAVHIRAGDIFGLGGKAIHPDYGQPPLSYYLGAIEREQPSRVWLIYQDRGNPCVDALEAELGRRGIPVTSQSAALDADLHVLLSARCLVAGIGTFVPAVASMSSRAKRLYLFAPPIATLQHLGIDIVAADDLRGDYRRAVWSHNWTASPEQRALMLAYPAEAIGFTDHPASR